MGLTIHYSFETDTNSPAKARQLVKKLRDRAMDLPFQNVGGIIELAGKDADFERLGQHDPHRWLLIQAGQYVERDGLYYHVPPTHLIAFSTDPGDGSEQANFGLAQYPATIKDRDGKRIRTGLSGWSWSSFCKTQYASNPECGGIENFLRCHLSVVKLLDAAQEIGILANVVDEGEYWEKRDVKALVEEIGEWNEMLAGFTGKLKDLHGDSFVAPITDFPNFEHLEAKGRQDESEDNERSE